MHDLTLVILNKNYSSWSMRPWVLLAHLGVPFTESMILGHEADAPERMRAVSPTAKMPVLLHDGLTVWESLAIAEYLAELHPDAELWPSDRVKRAEARAVAAEMHAGFVDLRTNCTMNVVLRTKRPLDAATRRDVDRIDAIFTDLRARHAADGPYLMGRFGIVDAMFAPVATRFRSYGIDVSPEAQAYVDTLLAHPAVSRFCDEAAREAERTPAFATLGSALGVAHTAHQPDAPCWAVIFANQMADGSEYGPMAERMQRAAKASPGYIDYVSTRSAEGFGITVSYWSSLEDIAMWRANVEHREAQRMGRERFYASYDIKIARVTRHHAWKRKTA
jgi:glutathione S-transferase